MQQTIKRRIGLRTGGQIQKLDVQVNDDAVIVRGFAPSYYVKQLALLGIFDVIGATTSMRIDLDVEVAASSTNSET
jgi:hypothetical protein